MVQPANRRLATYAALSSDATRADLGIASISRGLLPNGTDLNDLANAQAVGEWRMTLSNTYLNLPEGLTPQSTMYLRVSWAGHAGGASQTLIHGRRMFWRKPNVASTNTVNSWFSWQEAATQADIAGRKGLLPNGADLDDYYLQEHEGLWGVRAVDTIVNAPSVSGSRIMFRVEYADGFAVTQWWITISTGIWVRRHIQNGTWGEWYDITQGGDGPLPEEVVTSVNVDRIITSTNPLHPLEDGDLLIVYTD